MEARDWMREAESAAVWGGGHVGIILRLDDGEEGFVVDGRVFYGNYQGHRLFYVGIIELYGVCARRAEL